MDGTDEADEEEPEAAVPKVARHQAAEHEHIQRLDGMSTGQLAVEPNIPLSDDLLVVSVLSP